MINLFLDANTLLGLFGLSSTEVSELLKVPALVKSGDLSIWIPENVVDEFQRNRPKVLDDALRSFRDSRLQVGLPELSAGLSERDELDKAVRATHKAHAALSAVLREQIHERSLPADVVITKLFQQANKPRTAPVLDAARERRELRRPPGKNDAIGDAINWEALLADIPDGQDIHLVSSDGDFRSPLDRDALHDYLADEWRERKNGTATLYVDLHRFLAKHFAAIRVPSDIPKVKLIEKLAASPSFESTHAIVARLATYDVFTPEQASMIVTHAVRNNQVRWVAGDDDVKTFLTRVIDSHRQALRSEMVAILEACIAGDTPPFSSITVDDEKL